MNIHIKKSWKSINNNCNIPSDKQLHDLDNIYHAVSRIFIQKFIKEKINKSAEKNN